MRFCCAILATATVFGAQFFGTQVFGATTKDESKRPAKAPKRVDASVEKTGGILIVRGMRGGEPQLTDERGKRFLLTGTWRSELMRLGGHRVKVVGQYGAKKLFQPTVTVARYEIVDAGGGRRPQVGVLVSRKKELLLKSAESELQVNANKPLLSRLRKKIGCKVWIVGAVTATTVKASKFGWLSCKKEVPVKPTKGPKGAPE